MESFVKKPQKQNQVQSPNSNIKTVSEIEVENLDETPMLQTRVNMKKKFRQPFFTNRNITTTTNMSLSMKKCKPFPIKTEPSTFTNKQYDTLVKLYDEELGISNQPKRTLYPGKSSMFELIDQLQMKDKRNRAEKLRHSYDKPISHPTNMSLNSTTNTLIKKRL